MIFDSDVLIWFLRQNPAAGLLINREADRAISIISLMEAIQGARSKADVATIRGFLIAVEMNVLPVTEAISYAASALLEEHAHSDGLRITDALIAATARKHGAVLATGNVRHFRALPGLELKAFRPSS